MPSRSLVFFGSTLSHATLLRSLRAGCVSTRPTGRQIRFPGSSACVRPPFFHFSPSYRIADSFFAIVQGCTEIPAIISESKLPFAHSVHIRFPGAAFTIIFVVSMDGGSVYRFGPFALDAPARV